MVSGSLGGSMNMGVGNSWWTYIEHPIELLQEREEDRRRDVGWVSTVLYLLMRMLLSSEIFTINK